MTVKAVKWERVFKIEVEKLRKTLDKVKVSPIKTIGMNFLEGLSDIETMVELPRIIITHSLTYSEVLVEGLQICSKYAHGKNIKDIDIDAMLEEFRNKLAEIPLIRDKKVADRLHQLASPFGGMWADLELERFLKLHEQHRKSYFSLVYSSLVWIWTLFEIAIADLWETTLNIGFDTLGKDALNRMTKQDISPAFEGKMGGKYIKVNYLAEFDYNVRDNVGSILKHYFDFASLGGIKNAYKFAFPRSTTIEKSLDDDTLRLLAETRNLIVHKAGFIDARYKRITNTSQKIGDKLRIDSRHMDIYAAVTTRTFRNMLNSANQYIN